MRQNEPAILSYGNRKYMISGAKITLIVTGSIAAYKSAELVRELSRSGATVQPILTRAAMEFITPLTLQALAGQPVTTDLFDLRSEADIGHIALADTADVVLVAPATADFIAKAAVGIADDVALAVLLATKAPVVIAPAMNVNMWENERTQANVERLRAQGVSFVEPGVGELACGWQGAGRFAETAHIVEHLQDVLTPNDLAGSRVIVTAGPTREPIDPVRFVSNRSTGRMGYALARVCSWSGGEVHLVSGPTELAAPAGVKVHHVQTAEEMRNKVFELALAPATEQLRSQFVFMAAAVTDHRPAQVAETKLKHDKTKSYDLHLEPCPDILEELGRRRTEIAEASKLRIKLIGFSAEVGDEDAILGWARQKLERKNVDLMVGNPADEAFGKETNRVWLLERGGRQEEVATADKQYIAGRILRAALRV
ncbi:MAG: bifunctional phosphopantothenoylcysteine decarboxylase/phosphopantothenate--cysteine ligase CoaBC [Bdellovibrionales bacterium]|nr:bifunctional phosphopantothenoylcysteine decarboxylase/phosphopantothenate--cysteine ligase CoaBC [Bdellovibrionales bacterium]